MKTKDSARISIVQTVEEGIVQDPQVFNSLIKAQRHYGNLVAAAGFRLRAINETFSDYQDAFHEWEDTDDCPYDKMDWELHIWL